MTDSTLQKSHYENMHDEYEAHYFDASSMLFREKFIYNKLFKNMDLNNKVVVDLACSSGFNSAAVLERFPQAQVYGVDISAKACDSYRDNLNRPAFELDLTKGEGIDVQADVVMIFGGLHHCVADLGGTFKTIKKILKPGGLFLMYEPNKECFLEIFRKVWYRQDKYFEGDTEAALSHKELLTIADNKSFRPLFCNYNGGPAYFFIYNSLVFRIPLAVKKFIAAPCFLLERLYNLLPGKFFFPCFIATWKRQ